MDDIATPGPLAVPIQCAGAPSLPPELWAHVFGFVDSYSLWTACRKVSRTLRFEAEREMARSRLPRLKIRWEDMSHSGASIQILKTSAFLGLSDDNMRATYGLWLGHQYGAKEIEGFDTPRRDLRKARYDLNKTISHNDLDFEGRCLGSFPRPYARQELFISLNGFVNNCDIPALDVKQDWTEVSFDWKALLTDFYMEEQYVCWTKQAKSHTKVLPYPQRLEDKIRLGSLSWMDKEDDALYTTAFVRRLTRSHRRAGLTFAMLDRRPYEHIFYRLRDRRRKETLKYLFKHTSTFGTWATDSAIGLSVNKFIHTIL
ncbi:hypothetical protein N0V90_003493 [Kalmusia sp. IMI 367209]|nr:hypothetical protein N0V90_003493 [Kalmusia sp. IMI 367209]